MTKIQAHAFPYFLCLKTAMVSSSRSQLCIYLVFNTVYYCIVYTAETMSLRNLKVNHIRNKLTLIEVTSCMTIKGIKQATDDVAPTGYYIIGWHIVE